VATPYVATPYVATPYVATPYVYVFVRTDIPLADQSVQVAHVCLEAGNRFSQPENPSHLVLLAVSSQARLLDTASKIDLTGHPYVIFFEPDHDLGFTAICTGPLAGKLRRLFRRYPLWTSEDDPSEEHERDPRALALQLNMNEANFTQ
jgi:hypothetical protein